MSTARTVWRQLREFVLEGHERRREVTEETGLSFVRVKALRKIAREPMTLAELAERLVCDRPYATLTADALEERGLIVRTEHPNDRRRKLVTVTEAGRELVAHAERILYRPPEPLRALSAAELETLHGILNKLE